MVKKGESKPKYLIEFESKVKKNAIELGNSLDALSSSFPAQKRNFEAL